MANDGFLSKCFMSRTPLKRGKSLDSKSKKKTKTVGGNVKLLFAPKFNPLTQAVPLGDLQFHLCECTCSIKTSGLKYMQVVTPQ